MSDRVNGSTAALNRPTRLTCTPMPYFSRNPGEEHLIRRHARQQQRTERIERDHRRRRCEVVVARVGIHEIRVDRLLRRAELGYRRAQFAQGRIARAITAGIDAAPDQHAADPVVGGRGAQRNDGAAQRQRVAAPGEKGVVQQGAMLGRRSAHPRTSGRDRSPAPTRSAPWPACRRPPTPAMPMNRRNPPTTQSAMVTRLAAMAVKNAFMLDSGAGTVIDGFTTSCHPEPAPGSRSLADPRASRWRTAQNMTLPSQFDLARSRLGATT